MLGGGPADEEGRRDLVFTGGFPVPDALPGAYVHRGVGVPAGVNSFYVRSFAQVVGMLTATVLHTAATAVHATRRTS
jgi:hypothetical protein